MTGSLIYIGASQLQVPCIRWAKEQGLRVIVTDVNPQAPGIAVADGYEQIAGDDIAAMVSLGRDLSKTGMLAGCYCGSDFGLRAVATVGEELGVPAPSLQSVEMSLDKASASSTLLEHEIAVPRGWSVQTPEGLDAATTAAGYPLILKPTDSSGSRGVRTVNSASDLAGAYREARRHSDTVLIERPVTGAHIDVNGVFVDGVFYPCGLLSRFFSPQPHHYPVWGHEPCSLKPEDCQRVYREVEAGARALGIDIGPVKGDVIFGEDGPVILEISPRFHGDVSTSFVTPLATQTSAPRAWFAHLAGRSFEHLLPDDDASPRLAGWMGVFPDTPGVFDGMDGVDEARALPGIADVAVLKKPGYHISAVADNLAVMGFIWGEGETPRALHDNLCAARDVLCVRLQG